MTTVSRKAIEFPSINAKTGLIVLGLCFATLGTGCQQQRRMNWNPLNWRSLERLPPPATGSLNIPGVNRAYPTSALPSPPMSLPASQLPPNSGTLGQPTGVVNPLAPGVYFPNNSLPGNGQVQPSQSQPWQSTSGTGASQPYVNPASYNDYQSSGGQGNLPTGTYSTIPGRGNVTPNVSANPNLSVQQANPSATTFNMAAVPSLNPGGFDPFGTATIPNWNSSSQPAIASGANPMLIRSDANAGNPNQPGWWPTEVASSSGLNNSPAAAGIGQGQLLQRFANGTKSLFNRQPANLGGFQTTAAIENPMILATNYNAAPANYLTGQAVSPGQFPGNSPVAGPSFSQVLDAQSQQVQFQAMQRQMQAIAYQNALAARAGNGAGAMQVLAENTTSEIAENQNRLGLRAPVGNSIDPRYSGAQSPQGSAQAVRAPMLRTASTAQGLISASDQSGLNSSWQSTGVR